jgi:hypothetical protein
MTRSVVTRLAQLAILRFSADVDKEVEILVLRPQLAVLRQQVLRHVIALCLVQSGLELIYVRGLGVAP